MGVDQGGSVVPLIVGTLEMRDTGRKNKYYTGGLSPLLLQIGCDVEMTCVPRSTLLLSHQFQMWLINNGQKNILSQQPLVQFQQMNNVKYLSRQAAFNGVGFVSIAGRRYDQNAPQR